MKRGVAVLLAVVVVLASAAAGFGAWLVAREYSSWLPEISAYSDGHLSRVGPYVYCDVHLGDCQTSQAQGELPVNARDPVQLSVPTAIGRAPWQLLRVYEDGATANAFRPHNRLAVTIPTVDPYRGRLTGIVVQLMTVDPAAGGFVPHAEWSVGMEWG